MEKIEEVKGWKLFLEQDNDPMSPLEWDRLGQMIFWHRRYNLGDEHSYSCPEDAEEYKEFLAEFGPGAVVIPVYMYDHSGISLSTGRAYPFNDRFDSGTLGFIVATREKLLSEYKRKRLSKSIIKAATGVLEQEVAIYSQFLEGDAYCYRVEDPDGETVDSCCGFFGYEHAKQEALDALKSARKDRAGTLRAERKQERDAIHFERTQFAL